MLNDGYHHVIELLPDYVLEILTDEDKRQVAEHLDTCQECQAEYLRMQQVTEELPLALSQAEPPPSLKNKLMGEVRRRSEQKGGKRTAGFWRRLGSVVSMKAPAWALALIIVLALGNFIQWGRINQLSSRPTAAMIMISLTNTLDSPRAVGTLVMDHEGEYGTLVVDDLAELNPAYQYQVWLMEDGERTSGGVFSVNYEGYASLELSAPQPLIKYDAIGITIEPAGGSPGPTGAKVLGGDLPH